MKSVLQILFGLILGAAGLSVAIALMLRFDTSPATAFAYVLFFFVGQSIWMPSFRRDVLMRFAVGSVLCVASSFWVLRSGLTGMWEREDQFSTYSLVWRSAMVLVVLLSVTHFASYLASRSMNTLRQAAR